MSVERDGTSREILFRNPFPIGDPRHAAAGEEALEALLAGTDAEGFAGDRWLLGLAREALARRSPAFAKATVGEAYRLRSADRVQVLFFASADNPRAVRGLPGTWTVGLTHALEVTRQNAICFRSSPTLTRSDAAGWLLLVPDFPYIGEPRSAARETFVSNQDFALNAGLRLLDLWLYDDSGPWTPAALRPTEVAEALRGTALPKSVRERAAATVPTGGTLGDVAAALAGVAASVEYEEGETYARAAARWLRGGADDPAGAPA